MHSVLPPEDPCRVGVRQADGNRAHELDSLVDEVRRRRERVWPLRRDLAQRVVHAAVRGGGVEPQGHHMVLLKLGQNRVRVRDQIFDGLAGCPTRPLDAVQHAPQIFLVISAAGRSKLWRRERELE